MINVIIVGDTFPVPSNSSFFSNGDIESLFGEKICKMFSDADLSICNLEGALTDRPEKCNKRGPVIIAPTNTINAYKALGVDCCMLANNHISDGGHQGIVDTMKTLDDADICHIGAGTSESEIKRSLIYNINGFKIGLYNVCETMFNKPSRKKGGAWLYDEYIVCREIVELSNECDYLIVIYHGGIEQFRYPSPEIRKRFHRMADNGANMILSQHTHCIGCEEWYNGSYLLYGQGNFLFRNVRPGQTDEAIIIELLLDKGKVDVKKHLVKCIDYNFVRYNECQDFSAFNQRSEKLMDISYVNNQFNMFCRKRLYLYLLSCKNLSVPMRIIRKIFPNLSNKYLLHSFKKQTLMKLLFYLRSEQKREEAITGLEFYLDDLLNNRVINN